MNELQIFNYGSNPIRAIQKDGEPWFVLKDVCYVLGISKYRDTAERLDPDERGPVRVDTPGGKQEMTCISESGLYNVILRSDKPEAKPFRKWVTSEVLPTIRKTGMYLSPTIDSAMLYRVAHELEKKEQEVLALTAENEQQRQVIQDYEPKIQYLDTILESPSALATTQIAADYGISAYRLNHILHDEGIQHNVNGQWILYRKHMGMGYTKSKTISFTRSDGRQDTRMQTQWTQKGRLMIHEILSKRGIVAEMDKQ